MSDSVIKTHLRMTRRFPGWAWTFVGTGDLSRCSTAGWAWTLQGAESRAFEYIRQVADATGMAVKVGAREVHYR